MPLNLTKASVTGRPDRPKAQVLLDVIMNREATL